MSLPKIIKSRMNLKIHKQLNITLFPEDEGQPKIDIIKVTLREIEGKETNIFMTPCKAIDLCTGLMSAVQMYMFNQEQYRKDILEPKTAIVKERKKKKK